MIMCSSIGSTRIDAGRNSTGSVVVRLRRYMFIMVSLWCKQGRWILEVQPQVGNAHAGVVRLLGAPNLPLQWDKASLLLLTTSLLTPVTN